MKNSIQVFNSNDDSNSMQALTMTPSECGAIAGVSPRTISRMCKRGELKAAKFGKLWRINREAFMQYVNGSNNA